ncbi:MAG: alpha/beta hydrolase [Lentisphaerae bacterium]|nr:alpha/beta hydrolase [Lentisphaerota bacterium]MCP4103227.1 alpha/beta hydrolase [Lentisphaerota bacterium]
MGPDNYKFIDIDGIAIAYTDQGEGTPVLFLHGFASLSYTWKKVIEYLPSDAGFRFVTIDFKGFGYSEKRCDDHLAPFDQSVIVSEFIRRLSLRDFILVGHSMGGAIGLITLFNEKIRSRCSKLILVDSAGLFQILPEFIDDLTATSPGNPLLKLVNEELMALLVLKQAYYDEKKITEEIVIEYSNILKQKRAKECLISAAKQIAIANIRSFHENVRSIDVPTLIIWGEEDAIIDVEDAFLFRHDMNSAELKIIPECGHSPQEENPLAVAELIASFIGAPLPEQKVEEIRQEELKKQRQLELGTTDLEQKKEPAKGSRRELSKKLPKSVHEVIEASGHYVRKLKMRRLIDRWNLESLILIIFVKILQFLKKLGFSAEENGWRKASGIFLRNEHSKFILTSFRLKYYPAAVPEGFNDAKKVIIGQLADFLRQTPACHWTLEYGFMRVRRKKVFFTDLCETRFSSDGLLVGLEPYFDRSRPSFELLTEENKADALNEIILVFNRFRDVEDSKRSWQVAKVLIRWARKRRRMKYAVKQELQQFIERILNGTAIQFETLTSIPEKMTKARLETPNMKRRMHPGNGLLNIVCRFTEDYKEADLWFQYHHVPVDGMPMQEMLEKLKSQWGVAGQIKYPALNSRAARPEIFYFGNRIFRARIYVNFDTVLSVRKYLNDKYYAEMGGPATLSSMMVWGLAQSSYFRQRKFLLPVDTSLIVDYPQDRNISIVMIRPSKFFCERDPLDGFLKFQREFNQRLFATRMGKSESYELLELYSMIHPLFYYIAGYMMPKGIGELLGTAGLTIIKNAEMFISPLTDLHFNGFVALGNLKMPTEDGKTAGAVSICGSRERVKEYIRAIQDLTSHYADFLDIDLHV